MPEVPVLPGTTTEDELVRWEALADKNRRRADLTERQRVALAWLESVGKASEKLVRRHGFAVRTFDALVDAGLVTCDHMPCTLGGSFKVYRDA